MSETTPLDEVAAVVERVKRSWLEGRPADLEALFHPRIVMALPGFGGKVAGREKLVAGFSDFCLNAKILEFTESDLQIDVVGNSAVATSVYDMIYEREGARHRATGRDLWVYGRTGAEGPWLAVWRTMLDSAEEPA
ncbi:MAG: nuclear transport factor 2 family protein [Isosphaeraceae bacterium]